MYLPLLVENSSAGKRGWHPYLKATGGQAGRSRVVVTLVVSFLWDNQDTVSTWLLSCSLMCLEPLVFKDKTENWTFL